MNCVLDSEFVCRNCKRKFPITHAEFEMYGKNFSKLIRDCEVILVPTLPPLRRRIKNFVVAWAKHIWKRNPMCSEKETARRFSICQKCPDGLLVDGYCRHQECGCPITMRGIYFNKLHWKDQHCPMHYW